MASPSTVQYELKQLMSHTVAARPLKTKRHLLGAVPLDLRTDVLDTIWFTAEGNSVGYLDSQRKVNLLHRATGKQPLFLMQGTQSNNLWFTDPTGDAIGRINSTERQLMPDISTGPGSRPTAIGDMNAGGSVLFAATGGAIWVETHTGLTALNCGISPIDAIGRGPDGSIWIASGPTILALTDAGRPIGYWCNLPEGAQVSEFIANNVHQELYYCDRGRSVIGCIRNPDLVVEYALPADVAPRAVALGPSSSIWFTGNDGRSVFQLKARHLREFRCENKQSDLTRLVYSWGARQTIWFTEPKAKAITSGDMYGL